MLAAEFCQVCRCIRQEPVPSWVLPLPLDLVRDEGTDKDVGLNYKPGDVVVLTIKELENLEKTENSRLSKTAKELIQIVNDNPNRLLQDEVNKMIQPLGIEMNSGSVHLRYYRDSRRLSLVSSAATSTVDDTIRWVLIAPPNPAPKCPLKWVARIM